MDVHLPFLGWSLSPSWFEADVSGGCGELKWGQLMSWDDSETKKVGHMKAFAFNKWAFRVHLF